MPLSYSLGDEVIYTGPQLLGQPFKGTIVRLPVPHAKEGQPQQTGGLKRRLVNGVDTTVLAWPLGPARPGGKRHATDDMVMVRVHGAEGKTKHPIRPVRAEHLRKL